MREVDDKSDAFLAFEADPDLEFFQKSMADFTESLMAVSAASLRMQLLLFQTSYIEEKS